MKAFIIGLLMFIFWVIVIELSFYGFRMLRNSKRNKVRKRLENLAENYHEEEIDIVRKKVFSEIPFLNAILIKIPGVHLLDRLLKQADVQYSAGSFILLTLVLAATGFWCSSIILGNPALSLLCASLFGFLPFYLLLLKKRKRVEKFQRQFPEALDMIARALRAGHAFTSGMNMVANEFADPIGKEFADIIDSINFGASLTDALQSLSRRIDCPEVKFFAVAVIIQRESGGNLTEIIDNIAHLIRERFKFHGKVHALSAEGRFTALILIILPIFVMLVLSLSNPEYLNSLLLDPAGKRILLITALFMGVGILVIRKMIRIRI